MQFDTRSELASACGFMECGGIFELFQRVGIEWNLNTIPLGPRWLYRTSKIMMIVMRAHCRTMGMCLHAPLAQTKQTALSKFNIRRAPVLGHFGSRGQHNHRRRQRVSIIIALRQNTVNDIVPVCVEDSAVLRAPPTDSTIPPVDPVNGIDRKSGWIQPVAVML